MLCRWKWRCCPDRRTFSRCSNAYLLHQYLWPWSYTGMYKPLGHRGVVGNLNRVLKLSLATTVPPGNIKLLNLPSWKQGIKTRILFNDKPPRKKLWRITKQYVCEWEAYLLSLKGSLIDFQPPAFWNIIKWYISYWCFVSVAYLWCQMTKMPVIQLPSKS